MKVDESFLKDKVFVLKNNLLQKHLYLLYKCPNWKYVLLIQAPNISMQISRNKGATKKASTKMVNDKVFLKLFGKKDIFYTKC